MSHRMVHHAEVDSTMDTAAALVAETSSVDTIVGVVAAAQRCGRGSTGRAWQSPAGNVFLTIIVPVARIAPAVAPVLPLLVGAAVLHALRRLAPAEVQQQLVAKWPNDVLLGAGKVSGTIIDADPTGKAMLVGVGVNVAVAPHVADGGRRSACLNDVSAALDAPLVAEAVTASIAESVSASASMTRADVVAAYSAVMSRDVAVARRMPDGTRGEALQVLRLGSFGELIACDAAGAEHTLVSDYLF
jgi:BirA family biotin operon repressor/biotin-[acetyl-CoA-carboxylase] ligase